MSEVKKFISTIDANNAYSGYIQEHRNNVKRAWCEANSSLTSKLRLSSTEMRMISERVEVHDGTKYHEDEFDAYRMKFYPAMEDPPQIIVDKNFNIAWLHHIHHNKHHWEHWVIPALKNQPLDMDYMSIIEMLMDWKAMGYKFNNTPRDYFEKNKDKMILSDYTIREIYNWLPIVD